MLQEAMPVFYRIINRHIVLHIVLHAHMHMHMHTHIHKHPNTHTVTYRHTYTQIQMTTRIIITTTRKMHNQTKGFSNGQEAMHSNIASNICLWLTLKPTFRCALITNLKSNVY